MREIPFAVPLCVSAAIAVWWLARRAPWLRVAEMLVAGSFAVFAVRPSPCGWECLLYVPVGIALGVLAYAVSIVLLGNGPRRALSFVRYSPFVVLSGLTTPSTALHYATVALVEELVFRGYLQGVLLGGRLAGIAISTAAFVLIHVSPERRGRVADFVDLFLFSLALGVLYEITSSLLLVFLVHLVRNIAAAHAQRELRIAERRYESARAAATAVTSR